MVARGKFHVVNVEASQPVGALGQKLRVVNEAEVLLDLRVAGVVPIIGHRGGKFLQQRGEIGFHRQFFHGFPNSMPNFTPRCFASP